MISPKTPREPLNPPLLRFPWYFGRYHKISLKKKFGTQIIFKLPQISLRECLDALAQSHLFLTSVAIRWYFCHERWSWAFCGTSGVKWAKFAPPNSFNFGWEEITWNFLECWFWHDYAGSDASDHFFENFSDDIRFLVGDRIGYGGSIEWALGHGKVRCLK